MNKQELVKLLNDKNSYNDICVEANSIRTKYKGNEVHLRALIEFSNFCCRNCKYCGIRCDNKNIQRFRLGKDEIIARVKFAQSLGYKTIVLQSGEDAYFSVDILCEIISEIKKLNLALTLSIGEKTYEEYKAYKDSGADRYLLRIETTDSKLYQSLHPNSSHKNRFKCLENLKELGYEVGTGIMTGLPNQTIESIASDILFFKEINADMIGIGPFIPAPHTPFEKNICGSFELAIKTMALTRIVTKNTNIPATTAMETLNENGRIIALNSGANVIMPNLGADICKNYKIYYKNNSSWDNISTSLANDYLASIGRHISSNFGFRFD